MGQLIKFPKPKYDREAFIAAMWIRFLLTPGRETAPGEPVDLGEIGSVPDKSFERLTPYSLAQPR